VATNVQIWKGIIVFMYTMFYHFYGKGIICIADTVHNVKLCEI